ncbi:MAG: aminotransferase class IV [Cyanobacteria bacterium P01_C01_bin.121]
MLETGMQWFDGRLSEDNRIEIGGETCHSAHHSNNLGAALKFGASVFTTMRVYEQRLDGPRSQFSAHCDRLSHSIRAFGWQPPNWLSIHKGCQSLLQHYPVIRITLFPDGSEWITGRALPPELSTQQKEGIACWMAPATYARSLPTHKTGNYLACWLARQQAQKHGTQEAILTNARGDWLETATGNLWGWGQGQWWTPAVTDAEDTFKREYKDNCLPGLMREHVRRTLEEKGHIVNTQAWDHFTVSQFEAIAYTNCVVTLVPIHTILGGHTTLEYNTDHASLKALRRWLSSFL